MLIILRILFGVALAWDFQKVVENADAAPMTGDLTNAFYLAVGVLLAIANAVVWAPYFGERISDPITGTITRSTYVGRRHYLLDLLRWADAKGYRRCAIVLCFMEGVLRPDWPTAFVVALKNARPGSWLEKVFALEVFRFDNAQNCMLAYRALQGHGIDPRPHHNAEINLLFVSLEREVRPEPTKLAVPPAPDLPRPRRNRRIKLFEGADPPRPAKSAGISASAVGADEFGDPGVVGPETQLEPEPPALTRLTWWERLRALFQGS
jgi:hypothetical protein